MKTGVNTKPQLISYPEFKHRLQNSIKDKAHMNASNLLCLGGMVIMFKQIGCPEMWHTSGQGYLLINSKVWGIKVGKSLIGASMSKYTAQGKYWYKTSQYGLMEDKRRQGNEVSHLLES